jgi:argininosuccinate synthase
MVIMGSATPDVVTYRQGERGEYQLLTLPYRILAHTRHLALIIKAHHALEKHVLTKWQLSWKDQLSQFYGNWLHEGQYLDPVMRDMEAFLESTQHQVTGNVHLDLYPHRFQILGIESPYDLMSAKFGKYGEENLGWTGQDVKGFTKIFGNQTGIYLAVNKDAQNIKSDKS